MTDQERIAHLIRHLIRQIAAFSRYRTVFNWHPLYGQRLADVMLDLQRMGLVPDAISEYTSYTNRGGRLKGAHIIWSYTGDGSVHTSITLGEAVDRFRKSLLYHGEDYLLKVDVLDLELNKKRALHVSWTLVCPRTLYPLILSDISGSPGRYLAPAGESLGVLIKEVLAGVDNALRLMRSDELANVIKKVEKSIILMDEWVRVARETMTEWLRANPDEYGAMLWLCRQFPVRDRVWYVGIRDALDDLIRDVAHQLGVRSVHLDRRRSAFFGDGSVRAEWPATAHDLRVQYYTHPHYSFALEPLVPSEIKRVVEWVHNDVIPTLVKVAKDHRIES